MGTKQNMSFSTTLGALRASAEPTRLRILQLLSRDELSVLELTQVLNHSQPRVSRHLKLLTDQGLIDRFQDGAFVFYRLGHRGDGPPIAQTLVDWAGPLSEEDAIGFDKICAHRREVAEVYFEKMAPNWEMMRLHPQTEALTEAKIRSYFTISGTDGVLIDMGTGTGRMIALLRDLFSACIGFDLSTSMLNLARMHAGVDDGVRLYHADIAHTLRPAAEARGIIIHQVLHYLSAPESAILEAARLLAPGGRLLVVDMAPHENEALRQSHLHRRLGISHEHMLNWSQAANLTLVDTFSFDSLQANDPIIVGWLFCHQNEAK
jgi:ArsR family transcriptional regulator